MSNRNYDSNQYLNFKNDKSYISEVDFDSLTPKELNALFSKVLKEGMFGLCFSLYEDGQKPGDKLSKSTSLI